VSWLIDLISENRTVRAELNVPPSARPVLSVSGANEVTRRRLATHSGVILVMSRLEAVKLTEAPPAGSVTFVVGEATLGLPVAAFIDVAAEKSRLAKALAGLADDAQRVRRKLENPDFMARAPEAVVAENRGRLDEAEAAAAKLTSALAKLETVG
jgi:valyl-tRNA synthetase